MTTNQFTLDCAALATPTLIAIADALARQIDFGIPDDGESTDAWVSVTGALVARHGHGYMVDHTVTPISLHSAANE